VGPSRLGTSTSVVLAGRPSVSCRTVNMTKPGRASASCPASRSFSSILSAISLVAPCLPEYATRIDISNRLQFHGGSSVPQNHSRVGVQVGYFDLTDDITAAQRPKKVSGGGLEPAAACAMSRPFAQQCRSKQVWAASCYAFARVNAGRCSHGGNRLLLWVRWHRPPVRTESQTGLGDLASLHVSVKVLRP